MLVATLLVLPLVQGFSPKSIFDGDTLDGGVPVSLATTQSRQGALNSIWSYTSSTGETKGLGGGITYAWDLTVCDKLLRSFRERSDSYDWIITFVDCDEIRAAMGQAFVTWSQHHPALQFNDVTQECHEISTTSTHTGCSIAEIWITALDNTTGSDAAASATNTKTWDTNFLYTNGNAPIASVNGLWSTTKSTIGFSLADDVCWYIDASFCGGFHSFKREHGEDTALLYIRLAIFTVFGIAVAILTYNIYVKGLRQYRLFVLTMKTFDLTTLQARLGSDGALQWFKNFDNLKNLNITGLITLLTMLIMPIVLYVMIVMPCWECYDFKAAAAHEIGHALGFAHPDQAQDRGLNLKFDHEKLEATFVSAYGAKPKLSDTKKLYDPVCKNLGWNYVANDTNLESSIMKAFTAANPETCLFQDDLDLLNLLYPSCSDSMIPRVKCLHASSYLGFARLVVYVLGPLIICLIVALSCHYSLVFLQSFRREKQRVSNPDEVSDVELLLIEKQAMMRGKRHQTKAVKKWTALRIGQALDAGEGANAFAAAAKQAKKEKDDSATDKSASAANAFTMAGKKKSATVAPEDEASPAVEMREN